MFLRGCCVEPSVLTAGLQKDLCVKEARCYFLPLLSVQKKELEGFKLDSLPVTTAGP